MLHALRRIPFRTQLSACGCSSTFKEEQAKTEMMKRSVKPPTKEELQWRRPWHEKEDKYYSTLRTFYTEDNQTSVMKVLQTPINLSPSAIAGWLRRRKEQRDVLMQTYIPERNSALGNELAAAHFLVYRGGAVKFHGEDKWIKADENKEYSLPNRYDKTKFLEALDCSDMNLYYEGLANLRNLKNVTWLSLNGCETMDDWCMDRIGGLFSDTLVYLDLRNCQNISERGIGALYKLRQLRILYLDDFLKDTKYEMVCLMLQEANPLLDIRSDVVTFE